MSVVIALLVAAVVVTVIALWGRRHGVIATGPDTPAATITEGALDEDDRRALEHLIVAFLAEKRGVPKRHAFEFALRLCREAREHSGTDSAGSAADVARALETFARSPDLQYEFGRWFELRDTEIGPISAAPRGRVRPS